jgi:hypothetical protein
VLSDQVLESPNSSYAWIRYMAHHMGVGEIDKARGVAERALKTINFRCSPRPSLFLFLVLLHVKFRDLVKSGPPWFTPFLQACGLQFIRLHKLMSPAVQPGLMLVAAVEASQKIKH